MADGSPTWEYLRGLSEQVGTWAALLEPRGYREPGHWVVVDGISDEGVVLIRDPVGMAYGMPLHDFSALWRYTVVVIEEVP